MSRYVKVLFLAGLLVAACFTPAFAANSAPTVGAVTPASGSSAANQAVDFTATYSDPNGWQDLQYAFMIVNSYVSGASCPYVYYNQNLNKLYMMDDAATTWIGGFAPGSANVIQNSFAKLDCSKTTVTGTGTTLTVKWNITFKSTFTGANKTYLYSSDDSGLTSGWIQKGTWTLPNANPLIGTLSPSSGSMNANQEYAFTSTYTDQDGYLNIRYAYILINATLTSAESFHAYYDRPYNKLYLYDPIQAKYLGGYAPGSNNVITAPWGKLNCATTTVSGSGATLTVKWAITFYAPSAGIRKVYMNMYDLACVYSGWIQKGTVTLPNNAPTAGTISPPSGSMNVNQEYVFTATYNDPDGYLNTGNLYVLFNNTVSNYESVYLYYYRPSNLMYLYDPSQSKYIGGFTPGSSNTIESNWGKLSCKNSSVSGSGNTLTVKWAVTFKSMFTGTKNSYLCATDISGLTSGWAQKGTITLPNIAPTLGAISPTSGSSNPAQAVDFTTNYSDADGWQNIQQAYILINSTLSSINGCYAYYNHASNMIYLVNDAGTISVGGFTPGSANTIENSYVKVDCSKTTVTGSGSNLAIKWNLTFKALFAGSKKVYTLVKDDANVATSWAEKGAWTVNGSGPSVSITTPINNTQVNGTVTISASAASAGSGINKVEFYVDNVLIGTDATSPYSWSWNTKQATNDYHTIKVIAYDSQSASSSASITISVYNSQPAMNSVVTINGYQLIVQKRNSDGTLQAAAPYVIRGVAWDPASPGTVDSPAGRRAEFAKWVDTDCALMEGMNVNTIHTYYDFGTDDNALTIMDKLYQSGIMTIVMIDSDGSGDVTNALAVVNKYKNHPGVLMWMIGNEWNINCYNTVDPSVRQPTTAELAAAAAKTQSMALQIKQADPAHLVATGYGDLAFPSLASTQNFVANVCTSVDVWGINVYRGSTFGTTFTDWASISSKPLFISEFGTDSYRADNYLAYPITGHVDEQMQADFEISQWNDLFANLSAKDASKTCLGGTVFSWNDEWYKVKAADGGNAAVQDNGGYYPTWNPNAFPDSCSNEEYYGVVTISRTTKIVYDSLKTAFDPNYVVPISCSFEADSKCSNPEGTQWNTYARFYKNSVKFYDKVGYAGEGRGINVAVLNNFTGEVEATQAFDTYLSTANSDAMVTYLNSIQSGKIIMFATADEFTTSLTESAKSALESLGSQHVRQVAFRDSWAMITKKGNSTACAEDYGSGPKAAKANNILDAQ